MVSWALPTDWAPSQRPNSGTVGAKDNWSEEPFPHKLAPPVTDLLGKELFIKCETRAFNCLILARELDNLGISSIDWKIPTVVLYGTTSCRLRIQQSFDQGFHLCEHGHVQSARLQRKAN